MGMTRSEWNRRFKKTAVRRAHYEGFLRNVAVALGNWGSTEAEPALLARLGDPHPLVRGHVVWALGRVGSASARAALQRQRDVETDAWVLDEIDAALHGEDASSATTMEPTPTFGKPPSSSQACRRDANGSDGSEARQAHPGFDSGEAHV